MHRFPTIRCLLCQVSANNQSKPNCSLIQLILIIICSHITRQAQYNHPCLTSCYLYTTGERAKTIVPGPAHTQFNPHSALVPANPYLLEEIPTWLLIYVDGKRIRPPPIGSRSHDLIRLFSRITADPATDHKLKWDMFKLSELECFDSMMFRMFKQEMEGLISRHETYRYEAIACRQFQFKNQSIDDRFHSFQTHLEHGDKKTTARTRTTTAAATKISTTMQRIDHISRYITLIYVGLHTAM